MQAAHQKGKGPTRTKAVLPLEGWSSTRGTKKKEVNGDKVGD